jgi:hypothetical protein
MAAGHEIAVHREWVLEQLVDNCLLGRPGLDSKIRLYGNIRHGRWLDIACCHTDKSVRTVERGGGWPLWERLSMFKFIREIFTITRNLKRVGDVPQVVCNLIGKWCKRWINIGHRISRELLKLSNFTLGHSHIRYDW